MPINVIHPDGESPDGAPRRNAAVLGHSYFLDRFVVAMASIFATICLTFGMAHALGLRSEPFERYVHGYAFTNPDATAAELAALEAELLGKIYPFDPFAPVYEQFPQFLWNVATWEPIAVTVLCCGALAVGLQRYAY